MQALCEEGFEEGVAVCRGEGVSAYFKRVRYVNGPWDGQEQEVDRPPKEFGLTVAPTPPPPVGGRGRGASDTWIYKVGPEVDGVVLMVGELDPPTAWMTRRSNGEAGQSSR